MGPLASLPEGERGGMSEDHLNSPTLPSRYYTDPDIYREEMKKIHQRTWCYVGHVSDIPEPRDYFTDAVGEQPIAIVHGKDGTIRAFFNVCQHRGHELLTGRGKLKTGIVCPYHAWFYELDGTLRAARLTNEIAAFDKTEYNLRQVSLAIAAGLIFINIDPDCVPFEEEMSGFADSITKHLPGFETFKVAKRTLL